MLLTPAQRTEKRGVNVAEACSSAIDHFPAARALEWCADALDAYRELRLVNIDARRAEVNRLLTFAQNLRGDELLQEGRCAAAIALYRQAAAADPSVGADIVPGRVSSQQSALAPSRDRLDQTH